MRDFDVCNDLEPGRFVQRISVSSFQDLRFEILQRIQFQVSLLAAPMAPVRKKLRVTGPAATAAADAPAPGSMTLVGPLQRDVSLCVDLM